MGNYSDRYVKRAGGVIEAIRLDEQQSEDAKDAPFSTSYAIVSEAVISYIFNSKADAPPSLVMISDAMAKLSDEQQEMWGSEVRQLVESDWRYINELKISQAYEGVNI